MFFLVLSESNIWRQRGIATAILVVWEKIFVLHVWAHFFASLFKTVQQQQIFQFLSYFWGVLVVDVTASTLYIYENGTIYHLDIYKFVTEIFRGKTEIAADDFRQVPPVSGVQTSGKSLLHQKHYHLLSRSSRRHALCLSANFESMATETGTGEQGRLCTWIAF